MHIYPVFNHSSAQRVDLCSIMQILRDSILIRCFLFHIGSKVSEKRISIDNYTAHKGANHKQLYHIQVNI